MSKISEETRLHFSEAIQPYKGKITATLEKEKTMLNGMHKGDIDYENKKLLLCEDMIYTASLYMAQNSLSLRRSPAFEQSVVAKVMMMFGAGFMIIYMLFIGTMLGLPAYESSVTAPVCLLTANAKPSPLTSI